MRLLKNPYLMLALVALLVQSVLLEFFYTLPDPLGLSMSEMFEGKTLWQIFMAFGGILAMAGLFGFARAPRALAIYYGLYFFVAIVDYDVFRFSHQRLSYSFLRTYFHFSNITDATTVSTLGGDLRSVCAHIVVRKSSITAKEPGSRSLEKCLGLCSLSVWRCR